MIGLGWDEENWEARSDFYKEIKFLAKKYGVKESSIEIDVNHPCGEVCIFISGRWFGYIDKWFYDEMECGFMRPFDL
jgi:hypothetical protein